ncbi:hypothetical protein [Paenibacillus sp. ATY16]|uniref:hypothetical protein n=1 Tax=Paenibacillus sp. ATY16 TaxID=1759312 RepID=UPI00200E652A|nr:hypothetical protein [Paenibacillus sp. ATY16]MCK9857869.1 hypothetical protein [Paenibacillus sp. ATY16]
MNRKKSLFFLIVVGVLVYLFLSVYLGKEQSKLSNSKIIQADILNDYQAVEEEIRNSASLIKDVTFTKVNADTMGTSKLVGYAYESEEIARYRGCLLTLFGEPNEESTNMEQAFTYVIKAQRSDGSSWILTAYEGQSGFAIGGKQDVPLSAEMAYLLKQRIDGVEPSDFDRKGMTYPDTGEIYSYGCKNGICYANKEG